MRKYLYLKQVFGIITLSLLAWPLNAQKIVQTIRGSVIEFDSKLPLPGATVAVYHDSVLIGGSTSDINGQFRIDHIAVGRYTVKATFLGYLSQIVPDVVVNSSRQTILNFDLHESVQQVEEVVISGQGRKGQALNELASVSARVFSIDETDRYAGSRGDPARMASNYAGVVGNNDASNDIIIRGNSPLGLLWRCEGVNIPNPNHFVVAGTTGGPVGMLNNHILANSDFLTGAFPAEYGNAISGVFDLNMRNGNNENHEFSAQLGILGAEADAEGPVFRKKGSSYIAAYRYSTLSVINKLGINIGTDAIPYYQDFSFKTNFPINRKTNLSVFGIGGKSFVDLVKSTQKTPNPNDIYGNENSDEHFESRMGVMGLNITRSLNDKTFVRFTLSASGEHTNNDVHLIVRHVENGLYVIDSIYMSQGYLMNQAKYGASWVINQKINSRNSLNYGFYLDNYVFNFMDSVFRPVDTRFSSRLHYRGNALLGQPYFQWQFRFSDAFTINSGIHVQWFSLNNSYSIEPRAGFRWALENKRILSFGIGRHSMLLPTYIYFAGTEQPNGSINQPNRNVGFIKSDHVVAGFEKYFTQNLHLKIEAYYQHLFDVPVERKSSSYSLINEGEDLYRFFPDSLVNKGTGRNYGLELTLEKFFSQNYFIMFSGSLFDSKYRGSNGQLHNSSFNANYVANLLATREFHLGKKNKTDLGIGAKITMAGGKHYSPIDTIASQLMGEPVPIDSLRNTLQVKPYFRADMRVSYKINTEKVTHEIGLDLVNLFNIRNIFSIRYVGGKDPLREEYQLGFLPIFYYRIEF